VSGNRKYDCRYYPFPVHLQEWKRIRFFREQHGASGLIWLAQDRLTPIRPDPNSQTPCCAMLPVIDEVEAGGGFHFVFDRARRWRRSVSIELPVIITTVSVITMIVIVVVMVVAMAMANCHNHVRPGRLWLPQAQG
jgi:hypothetical protein